MSDPEQPPLVVHLVHGTWAHGRTFFGRAKLKKPDSAPCWFEPGSSFRKALEGKLGPRAVFPGFTWSGENSFADRKSGADKLRRTLTESLQAHPGAVHALVAHSHGGTVAFRALQELPPELGQRVATLVTLATPFVTLRRAREFSLFRLLAWRVAFLILIVAAGNALGALFGLFGPEPRIAGWILGLLALPAIAVALFGPGFIRALPPSTAVPDDLLDPGEIRKSCPLLALRAPSDEAGLVIAAAQFLDDVLVAFTLKGLSGGGTRLNAADARSRWTVPLLMIALWGGLALALAAWDKVFGNGLGDIWMYPLFGVFYLPSVLLAWALALVLLVFGASFAMARATGPEALRYAGTVVVEAETLPPGLEATVWIAPLSGPDSPTPAMRHSLYELPQVEERVAAHLAGLRPRAASPPA